MEGKLASATIDPSQDDRQSELSPEGSLEADTSRTPPSIWSRSFPAEEPDFSVPLEESQDQSQSSSRLRDYQESLAERVRNQINRQKGLRQRARQLNWAERSRLRQETTKRATQKVAQTAVKTLGKLGGRAVGAALGNVVGAVIAAALTVKDIIVSIWGRFEGSYITSGVLIVPVTIFAIYILAFFSSAVSHKGGGPHLSGSRDGAILSSQELAGLASGQSGIISATSVADLQKVRARLTAFLQRSRDISVDSRNKASDLLSQMNAIEKSMNTSAHASDKSEMANNVKAYQKLVYDFYAIVLPNAGSIRGQYLAMVDSGILTTNNFCSGVDQDLRSGMFSIALMDTLVEIGKFATANGLKIEITCLVHGHKNPKSYHRLGQAADIEYTGDATLPSKLLPFLWDNRERLQLAEIIFNVPVNGQSAGFYNYNYNAPNLNHTTYAGNHTNHIHVSTRL